MSQYPILLTKEKKFTSSFLLFLFNIQVPLGVLPKNENLDDDMVDIVETIQEKFVSRSDKEKGLKTVFFGGTN